MQVSPDGHWRSAGSGAALLVSGLRSALLTGARRVPLTVAARLVASGRAPLQAHPARPPPSGGAGPRRGRHGGDPAGRARGTLPERRVRLRRGAAGLDVLLRGAALRPAAARQSGGLARRLGPLRRLGQRGESHRRLPRRRRPGEVRPARGVDDEHARLGAAGLPAGLHRRRAVPDRAGEPALGR